MLCSHSGMVSESNLAHQMLCCLKNLLISEHLLTRLACNFLYTFVAYFAFQRWYLKRFSWKVSTTRIGHVPQSHWDVGNPNDHFQVVAESNQDRWEKNVAKLTVIWDLIRMGGTLSVPYVRSIID